MEALLRAQTEKLKIYEYPLIRPLNLVPCSHCRYPQAVQATCSRMEPKSQAKENAPEGKQLQGRVVLLEPSPVSCALLGETQRAEPHETA
ncbi:hypothetical protein NDU88_011208 [Pleurodeles waltl]|uniref:Uncharacterized protein n=1 Tax=Pleurodeles waltl TaxID=8319 RepID=A0AAV7Q004_PLEWA|nr:hypothetical protein NDU88_011208 [Pleurodeles waltl]